MLREPLTSGSCRSQRLQRWGGGGRSVLPHPALRATLSLRERERGREVVDNPGGSSAGAEPHPALRATLSLRERERVCGLFVGFPRGRLVRAGRVRGCPAGKRVHHRSLRLGRQVVNNECSCSVLPKTDERDLSLLRSHGD